MEKASSIPQVNSLSSLPAITSVPKKANGSFLACHFKPLFLSFVWWGLPSGPFFLGGGGGFLLHLIIWVALYSALPDLQHKPGTCACESVALYCFL